MTVRWARGDVVTWRNVNPEVEYAFPAIVVDDRPELIVLYQPHGTVAKRMAGVRDPIDGRTTSSQLAPAVWTGLYEDYVYTGPNVLRAYTAGEGYSVIRSVGDDLTTVYGWYINIEKPWRRTSLGFDSRDLVVDLRRRDGSWQWEDENELAWAVSAGVLTPEEEDFARRTAHDALATAQKGTGLFAMDWTPYLPDPSWGLPAVSDDWRSRTV